MKRMMRIKTMVAVAVFFWLMAAFMVAVPQAQAEHWSYTVTRFSAIAGETVALGNVVCISGSDGYVYKADANDSGLRPAVGVIKTGGASGARVEIVVDGTLTGQTAASPGARVFLSETAGAITTTAPTNAQALGWVLPGTAGASSSTTYFIRVVTPSSGGAGY